MNAEQMFNDLDYKKRIEDGCIKFERHTENVDEGLIEFDLDTKTVCASWFMEQKEITIAEFKAIQQQLKELHWIDEKAEIKEARNPEVTNFEHYKDEILEECSKDLAVVKGRPKLCYKINCNDCDFKINQIGCHEKVKDWLKQTYEKPKYKLTQCEYDMLDTIFEKEARFSKVYLIGELKKKGYFENIKCDSNVRVKDILANCEVVG